MRALTDLELLAFVDDLRLSVEARLPLPETFERLTPAAPHRIRTALHELVRGVRSGDPLSEAVRASGIGGEELRAVLAAGERAGDLATPLRGYAAELERRVERKSLAGAALVYPSILLACVVATLAVLVAVARAPRSELLHTPISSTLLLSLSILGCVLPILLLAAIPALRTGQYLPGGIARDETKARAFRTLRTLLVGGVTLPEALRVTASGMSDREGAPLSAMADQLGSGVPFAEALPGSWLDPIERLLLARSGGALPRVLGRLSEAAEDEVRLGEKRSLALFSLLVWGVTGLVAGAFIVTAWSAYFDTLSGMPF